MQNDFITDGAPIEYIGGKDIVPNFKQLKKWTKEDNIPVMYAQELHRGQMVAFGLELKRHELLHCMENIKGSEIIDELKPDKDDYVIIKRRYSISI